MCRAAQGRGQYRENREGKTASFSCSAGLGLQPFQAWPGQELREARNAVIVRYAKDLWKRQKARKWEEKMRKKLRERENERKKRKKELGHHNVKPGSFLRFKWVITGEKVSSSSTNTASSEILISVQTITSQPQLGGDHHCQSRNGERDSLHGFSKQHKPYESTHVNSQLLNQDCLHFSKSNCHP